MFSGIQPKWAGAAPGEWAQADDLYLLGDEEQLQVFEVDNGEIRVVWRAVKGEVTTEKGRYLSGEYSLEGGQWLAGSDAPERLVVRMGRFSMRRSTDYYRDLLNWAC